MLDYLNLIFAFFEFPYSKSVDYIFIYGLKSGLERVYTVKGYPLHICFKFKNGWEIMAWNKGRFHAWLNKGILVSKNGEPFSWRSRRPSVWTMVKILHILNAYDNETGN